MISRQPYEDRVWCVRKLLAMSIQRIENILNINISGCLGSSDLVIKWYLYAAIEQIINKKQCCLMNFKRLCLWISMPELYYVWWWIIVMSHFQGFVLYQHSSLFVPSIKTGMKLKWQQAAKMAHNCSFIY